MVSVYVQSTGIFIHVGTVHLCFLQKATNWFSELSTATETLQLIQCSPFSDSGSSRLSMLYSHTLHSRQYPCTARWHSRQVAFNATLHLKSAKAGHGEVKKSKQGSTGFRLQRVAPTGQGWQRCYCCLVEVDLLKHGSHGGRATNHSLACAQLTTTGQEKTYDRWIIQLCTIGKKQ